ncbi:protein of unknown function VcgC/VcgE [Nitrosomonas sp. PY1]|uniref:DUF2780 domain-containing protein n=1 Tax=Nitrosomonas sp. PY1 TaxID=1803906 RepID=UPI001FC8E9F6|nr:DUF2780 domain-containing protein [Nitrosomonas sp. PY1]GKS68263.1 protein of unknown function VcgC/VcgE [Nitrosomonas sp. PY1]
MNKTKCTQLSIAITILFLAGCAANPGVSTSDGVAAQTGQQALNAGSAAASSSAGLNQIGLVDILVHRLGVSPQQALGGAGAVFQAAKGNMDPQAFTSLSESVPGMSTMLGAAPSLSGATGLGGMSSMLGGASSGSSGSLAALAGSFQQLNLSPDMVGKFIPVITNYVQQSSGQASAQLLQSALGVR